MRLNRNYCRMAGEPTWQASRRTLTVVCRGSAVGSARESVPISDSENAAGSVTAQASARLCVGCPARLLDRISTKAILFQRVLGNAAPEQGWR